MELPVGFFCIFIDYLGISSQTQQLPSPPRLTPSTLVPSLPLTKKKKNKPTPSPLCISHMLIGSCLLLTEMFSPLSYTSMPK